MKSKTEKQIRLRELKSKIIPELLAEIRGVQDKLDSMRKRAQGYENDAVEIALSLTPPPIVHPKVSDHALVRYLERHHKFDLDKFRNEILTEERIKFIQSGAKEIKCNGLKFKIENNVVVTIV